MEKNYLWCLHCECVYVLPEGTDREEFECPFCGAWSFGDSKSWGAIRSLHQNDENYPEIPEVGKCYPMY
jgi:hypothetical protein